ncbi:MAG: hypothetical protein QW273_02095 [Candidatus Pacearchaeota archaeon]
MVIKKSQMRIQQMAFMIVAVFIFFIFAGLFLLNFFIGDLRQQAYNLEKEKISQALSSWTELPEFSCTEKSKYCIDETKIEILMSNEIKKEYEDYWPVSFMRVYKLEKMSSNLISCPNENCNYYEIINKNENSIFAYSTYVSLCRKVKEENFASYKCELAKFEIGMKKPKKEEE